MTEMAPFLYRFIKDLRGAVAVEFALIVPVMLVILTGIIEMSNLMMASRRVSGAAFATADLISQETDLRASELDEIFQVALLVMQPLDNTSLTLGAASVRYDENGAPVVDWTASMNGGSVTEPEDVATDLGDAGESVIIVTATYSYIPKFNFIISGPFTLTETSITRPRYIDFVGVF